MKYILILFSSTILFSCNWFKEKGKQTVNKTGEVVAKAGAELADGMSKGVEKTFSTQAILSEELIKQGLKAGK